MKFSVGYQYPDEYSEERFPEILQDYSDSIAELYFAPGNEPGARSPAAKASGLEENEAWEILTEDIVETRKMGIKLNLLFNANCLGSECISKELQNRIVKITGNLMDICQLDTVTTASWFIAGVLKKHFPQLEIRASVNMKLGTLEALNYASERFDGFCIQRDINYHPETLRQISDWAKANNKNICLLANSGCLNFCSARTFHDNLVAHQHEIVQQEDPVRFEGICTRFLKSGENRKNILAKTNFIRPEDVVRYHDLCDGMKLATRTNFNPMAIVFAYFNGRFHGNLLDLTEPAHSAVLPDMIVANDRIPENYIDQRFNCNGICENCNICREIQDRATVLL